MKNKLVMYFLFFFLLLLGAEVKADMVVNHQETLPNGLKTEVKGTLNSIDDLNNGNLMVKLITKSEQDPESLNNMLIDGTLQFHSDSELNVLSGNVIETRAQWRTFDISQGQPLPSIRITNIGKTRSGINLDVLVTITSVSRAQESDTTVVMATGAYNSLTIAPRKCSSLSVSYTFQNRQTHEAVDLLYFPVIGDVDFDQSFQTNASVLGWGDDLQETEPGLFGSITGNGRDGLADFPLGSILYQFYGSTLTSRFDLVKEGASVAHVGVGFEIFGSLGGATNYTISKPDFGPVVIPNGSWKTETQNWQAGQEVEASFNQPINALDVNINHRYSNWETTVTLPSEIKDPKVTVLDHQGNVIPQTITPLSDHVYKVTIRPETMKTLPFNGETYRFVVTGTLDPELTDGSVLSFNADTLIDGQSHSSPHQTAAIAHKASIKVKYLRQDSTDSVLKSKIYKVSYGKAWKITPAPAPKDYYYDQESTKDALSGARVDFEEKKINLYYAATQKNVKVNYVDESGQTIAESTQFKADYLDVYTTSAQDVDDQYSLLTSKIPSNASGLVGNRDVEVTYVYRATKGDWIDLGYGSRGITRLDYHGHIRSNTLNYADGQIITLLNTSQGIEYLQDTVQDGALSNQMVAFGQKRQIKVSNGDTITIEAHALGQVTLTRQTPTYTMIILIQKGNLTNTTTVYSGKTRLEKQTYQANGVKGLLVKSEVSQWVEGNTEVKSQSLPKEGVDLRLNTSVVDAPETVFTSQLVGEEATTVTPTNARRPQTPKIQTLQSSVLNVFRTTPVSADTLIPEEETGQEDPDANDTMADNSPEFTTSLTGSAQLPVNEEAGFDASEAKEQDDESQANRGLSGQLLVTAIQDGKTIKTEQLKSGESFTLPVKDSSGEEATVVAQAQGDSVALGQEVNNQDPLPLVDGQLPQTGTNKNRLMTFLGLGLLVLVLVLLFVRYKKQGGKHD